MIIGPCQEKHNNKKRENGWGETKERKMAEKDSSGPCSILHIKFRFVV